MQQLEDAKGKTHKKKAAGKNVVTHDYEGSEVGCDAEDFEMPSGITSEWGLFHDTWVGVIRTKDRISEADAHRSHGGPLTPVTYYAPRQEPIIARGYMIIPPKGQRVEILHPMHARLAYVSPASPSSSYATSSSLGYASSIKEKPLFKRLFGVEWGDMRSSLNAHVADLPQLNRGEQGGGEGGWTMVPGGSRARVVTTEGRIISSGGQVSKVTLDNSFRLYVKVAYSNRPYQLPLLKHSTAVLNMRLVIIVLVHPEDLKRFLFFHITVKPVVYPVSIEASGFSSSPVDLHWVNSATTSIKLSLCTGADAV
ncbi:hypothetical protein JB92DRAFT_2833261 [Gautieria morchelliformis]|nr:hypothetical protein JB92DRAFT_2833261 [Gautieria morchelliformis]